jgi:hypothetical protein
LQLTVRKKTATLSVRFPTPTAQKVLLRKPLALDKFFALAVRREREGAAIAL